MRKRRVASTIAIGTAATLALVLPALSETGEVPALAAGQESNNWIEYRVGGDASEEHRDVDLLMCSTMSDGARFGFRSLGEWTIGVEVDSTAFGEHEAQFDLTPPDGKYRSDDLRSTGRASGTGRLVLEDGGRDSFGFAVFKGTFSVLELPSDAGFTFELDGSFSCPVFEDD